MSLGVAYYATSITSSRGTPGAPRGEPMGHSQLRPLPLLRPAVRSLGVAQLVNVDHIENGANLWLCSQFERQ